MASSLLLFLDHTQTHHTRKDCSGQEISPLQRPLPDNTQHSQQTDTLLYLVCIAVLTLDAGLLARSQYPEGPATGHLDTGFSWFPCVYKRMLRWFPSFQVATTCLSCSPPDLNSLVTFFPHICVHVT